MPEDTPGILIVDFDLEGTSDGYISGSLIAFPDPNNAFAFQPRAIVGQGTVPAWCESGTYDIALLPENAFVDERRGYVITDLGAAHEDGVWTDQISFQVLAHKEVSCPEGYVENGMVCDPVITSNHTLRVTYKGAAKTYEMNLLHAEVGTGCTVFPANVWIVVYNAIQADGTYFEFTPFGPDDAPL